MLLRRVVYFDCSVIFVSAAITPGLIQADGQSSFLKTAALACYSGQCIC